MSDVSRSTSTWVVGDVQGCFSTFERLLAAIDFRPARDRLWLAGDLVNRGPGSLETLRWAREQAERGCLAAVLGNHDLYLLERYFHGRPAGSDDTLEPVLSAPDAPELLAWLRGLPLLLREGRFALVHAGLLPAWTIAEAERRARRAEARLLDDDDPAGDLAVLTRVRTCDATGAMAGGYYGPPAETPAPLRPWFRMPHVREPEITVLFGHWAAAGPLVEPGLVALDSGCVWGGALTAYRLEDGGLVQVPAARSDVYERWL